MFEGLLQPMHLLVILIVCMFVFGPKKLPELGKGLGEGIRSFKDAIKDGASGDTDATSKTDEQKPAQLKN
ncbi:MAG: twin-arginine translocase TatA/TatE family subunit [Terriglobales bacterium]